MTQGRRGFFAKLLGAARELDAELSAEVPGESDPSDTPRFIPPPVVPEPMPEARGRPARRPPGALPEAEFASTCTRCKACIEACPESTLALDAAGLPIAEPWRSACALCPTTPCIAACEPRALTPTPPHEIRIGLAVVLSSLCLNQDDDLCDRCLDWCPVPLAITTAHLPEGVRPPMKIETPMGTSAASLGPAPAEAFAGASSGAPPAPAPALRGPSLPLKSDSPIPTVDPNRCTGCGLCVAQCPALPRAIALR